MIQRIQTIYFVLAAITFGVLFLVPFATSSEPIPNLLQDQVYNIMDSPVLIGLTAIGILVSLVGIFLYGNRSVQARLGYFTIISGILLPLVAILLIYNEGTVTTKASLIKDGFGIYLPILALIFGILAVRNINKDEKLVQSMDRLR
ncbi:MAG: DUF4293 domain-containing protein [Saprospiraceae bacterium]